MHYSHSWISFPPHLSAPSVRSLSLLFIFEEILSQFEKTDHFEDFSSLQKLFALEDPFPREMIPDKLCFYCHILLQTSQVNGQSVRKILDETRIAFLQFRSDIFQSKLGQVSGELFVKLWRQKLCALFSTLVPFLHEARTDENVLLSLLEKRELFNKYLGEKTIENLLSTLFPQGKDYWHAVLYEGFQRRNFSKFFESKEHLLTDECTDNP